ncbi:hypothetical protein J422_04595 [Methanocaldococcus villosus KIN24-T80]|uniref:Uncharacterized protein n=1 Tax=Methanocaldococcus villosus KIN24-T80 TaxID=1069083 RepID=N6UUL9_9EURY|nr:hypothetical protein [Methanocaldococcus villosus]ENN96034.1 hypothetical protein J422_04595 [Methanocaldococcus villosus KIN24-T80]
MLSYVKNSIKNLPPRKYTIEELKELNKQKLEALRKYHNSNLFVWLAKGFKGKNEDDAKRPITLTLDKEDLKSDELKLLRDLNIDTTRDEIKITHGIIKKLINKGYSKLPQFVFDALYRVLEQNPEYNICVEPIGEVVAYDLDSDDYFEIFKQAYYEVFGEDVLKDTFVEKTKQGYHIFLRLTNFIPNGRTIEFITKKEGKEFARYYNGKYEIVYPSIRVTNPEELEGIPYTKLSTKGLDELKTISLDKLKELEIKIVELLEKKGYKVRNEVKRLLGIPIGENGRLHIGVEGTNSKATIEVMPKNKEELLNTILEDVKKLQIEKGERSDWIFALTLLFKWCGLSCEDAFNILTSLEGIKTKFEDSSHNLDWYKTYEWNAAENVNLAGIIGAFQQCPKIDKTNILEILESYKEKGGVLYNKEFYREVKELKKKIIKSIYYMVIAKEKRHYVFKFNIYKIVIDLKKKKELMAEGKEEKEALEEATTKEIIEYPIFKFMDLNQFRDIILNKNYVVVKGITTIRNNNLKNEYELRFEDITGLLNYVSTDATREVIKKVKNALDVLIDAIEWFANNKTYESSCLFRVLERDGKLTIPKVEHHPILHQYESYPTPEEYYKMLMETTYTEEEKKQLLETLYKLNKPHNVLVMAYFLASLLVGVVDYEITPFLILYGKSGKGKSKTARIFNFVDIKTDRLTEYQYKVYANGWGCGFGLLDECKELRNELIQLLKENATSPIYDKKHGQKYRHIYKLCGILTCNDIFDLKTNNPDDLAGFLRRQLTYKVRDEDIIEGIGKDIKYLLKNRLKLQKIFIDWILKQDPQELREVYETIEEEEQYKFIYFGLGLLFKFWADNGFDVNKEYYKEILRMLKAGEQEFKKDVMNDEGIIDILHEVVYNRLLELVKSIPWGDKKVSIEELEDWDILNHYAIELMKKEGYTIYRLEREDKIRIAIQQRGLIKLLSVLKKRFKMNYPDKITLEWFANKLREDHEDHNIEIKQIKISGKKFYKCLVIDLKEEIEEQDLKEEVKKIVEEAGIRGMTTTEVCDRLGLSEDIVERVLKELHREGEIDNPRPNIWIRL